MDRLEKSWAAEQAELEVLLSSALFTRAPSLASFLEYVCRRTFAGEGELIKEYNIAVEALGRPADFNQKRDAIVRVEAHRLRRRLKEYYETEGASHEIRIMMPERGYQPLFLRTSQPAAAAEAEATEAPLPQASPEEPVTFPASPPVRPRPSWIYVALGTLTVAAGVGLFAALGPLRQPAVAPSTPPALEAMSEVRIACGSSAPVVDREGHTWVADAYFEGGRAQRAESVEIQGTMNPDLFRFWREGEFRYRIPLKEGVYELTLLMMEPIPPGAPPTEGSRLYNVLINGTAMLEEYDVYADAGGAGIPVWRVFRDVKADEKGWLTVAVRGLIGGGVLHALSVLPGSEGRLRPVRIAARETPYTDSQGRHWTEDRHFQGGRLVTRIETVSGTDDPELYRGERYGRFRYVISLPPGSTYTLILHFAETWWGGAGLGGEGSRLFDVLANGQILERNFDVYRVAQGPFRAITRTYHGLQPRPSGRLVLEFIPSKNYAFLNALEILDERSTPKAGQPSPSAQAY